MSVPDRSPFSPPTPPSVSAEAVAAGLAHPSTQTLPPGYVEVLCPQGFTASSRQEHANARPLFARLIYLPCPERR